MRGPSHVLKLLLALAAAFAFAARADDVEVREANLRAADEGLVLNAEFAFDFNARLADAVANGVPLYFVIEFELTRPRWYWLDERTASKRQQVRLSYHALSRHYRLSTGLLQQNFDTLESALAVLRRVNNWLVVDRTVSLSDARYEAGVRMRLELALLPKPIQISAYTSNDWNLDSAWRRFPFRAPQQPPAPVESREPTEASQQ